MSEYVSAISRLAFGREASFGAKPSAFSGGAGGSSAARFLGITNQTIDPPDQDNDIKKYRSFGAGRRWFTTMVGRQEFRGTIPFVPTTGELFYYAFGIDSFTGGSPNVHVMYPEADTATLPSFTLANALLGSPNFLRCAVGCTIDSLSLSLNENAELNAVAEIIAKDVENEDDATPTLFTQPTGASQVPYMFYDRAANITIDGTYNYTTNAIAGGRSIARVKSFNWELRNNLDPKNFSQSTNAQKVFVILKKYPDFSLSMDVVPAGKKSGDTDAIYDLLVAGTQGDILIPFQRSASDRLDFVFDNARIKAAPHSLSDDGGEVSVPVTVECEEIRVVARDSIATYGGL